MMIGQYFDVDRVYIFENSEDDLACSNTFEWCNTGIEPEIDVLQGLSYIDDLGGDWIDNYNEDGLFFCPTIANLPEKQRIILEPQGITSMLQCAIKERGEFKGYIGFDNCQTHLKGWENDQDAVDTLVFISRLLTLYLLEYRNKSQLIESTKRQIEQEEKKNEELAYALNEAKQATEAKSTFLAKMSHEIRTPMNAIIGYLSIAQDCDGDVNRILHCIDNSQIAARELLQIINDVLDMSAIEQGKIKIAETDFDLKREIMDVTTIFFQTSRNKGVRFETRIDSLTEEWVVGDKLRLKQVLMNLLSNAIKFTDKDGLVTLGVHQLRVDETKVWIQFSVKDTGIGMSEAYMDRLFQPFEQESATTAQKYGGSGLGLSITGNLVSLMGGTINVKSTQGEGSTFTLTVPFNQSKHRDSVKPKLANFAHLRALVVDDHRDAASYVRAMLKRCGIKADVAVDGPTAIHRIQGRLNTDYAYDFCILDWSMPKMDGIELARTIRQSLGEDMPIIIATAYDVSELDQVAKEAGVNKVVAKPLFQSTLMDLIVSTFGGYEPQPEKETKNKVLSMKGVHVLLAEDNVMNMEIAVTVLEKAGIVVDQAVNGEDAVAKFNAAKPDTYDLILMDVQMPVMDGYGATQAIRHSSHPRAKTIPIIAMTANAFAEDVARALANGMNAHIAKPINYDKLFKVLSDYSRENLSEEN